MKLSSIQVFKLMYCALDGIWSNSKDEKLSIFLSDANPFLCVDGSADPVVYNDFAKSFGEDKELKDFGYSIIIDYLTKLDNYYGDILSYFKSLTEQEYIKISTENLSLPDDELKRRHI